MKTRSLLFLTLLFAIGKFAAQTYVPVATTGYTLDAIAENTTAVLTTGGPIDGSDYVLYSAAYGAMFSSTYGLPNSGTIASGTKTFQLQNYTGPNLLYITSNAQDSLSLVTPSSYLNLSILGFATEGAGSMSVTVRFTDNTTQVFTGVAVNDWFSTASTPFYQGFDRAGRTSGSPGLIGGTAGNPRMYSFDLLFTCASQSKVVKRIIIKNTTTARLCLLGVAGVVSPLTISGSPVNFCNSGTSTLTANAATGYTWLPTGSFAGSNSSSITVTNTVTTSYTVQTANTPTCTLSGILTVNVYTAVPSLTVVNSANVAGICPSKTVNLTASGATTYTWAGGVPTVTNGVTFLSTSAIDYTVTGTNACGTNSVVSSVSVHPLPVLTPAASSSSICSGSSVTLTTTGTATSTVWSGHTSSISAGVGFSPTVTATYTVIGTSALTCTASASIPVTVVTTPTLAPTASPSIGCIGTSMTLSALGATNYTWTGPSQTGNASSLIVVPTVTGVTIYTVTKANSNCSDTKTISVTTNSLPSVFAISTPTLVCALSPATLAVGGGVTYTWSSSTSTNTFGGPSPIVYPQIPTTYTVAASDGTCISRVTVSVAVDPTPTLIPAPTSSNICVGQPVTVNITGGNNYTVTSTSGATFYTSAVTETPVNTVAYTIVGDNSFGCTSTVQQVIVVNPNPTVSITSNKTLVCSGNPATLTASGATNYTWTSNNALTNTTAVNPTNTASGPVIFTVSGSYTTGCTSSKTISINVFVPVLTVSGTTNTCPGGLLTLIAGGGNNGTYSWHTGTTTSNFQTLTTTLTAPAVFTLNASTTSITANCPATKTIAVGIYTTPVIMAQAVAQRTTICIKESVQLYGQGGVSYVWNTSAITPTITVAPTIQTNYTVTGTDANGCVSTGTIQVKVSNCLGVNELNGKNNSLLIYPNPNNGEFTIQADEAVSLRMINELGQVVKTIDLSENNTYKVSITDLAQGIYFITGQHINQKVVVTK